MGQAHSDRTLTAQKFILVDAAGKTRGELGLSDNMPHLFLYGTNPNTEQVQMVAGYAGGSFKLSCTDGSTRAILETTKDGAILNLFDADKKGRAHLGVGSFDYRIPNEPGIAARNWLTVFGGMAGPSLVIEDKEGFSTIAGSVNLKTPRTGESQRTSAASVALIGKDGQLLWSAP